MERWSRNPIKCRNCGCDTFVSLADIATALFKIDERTGERMENEEVSVERERGAVECIECGQRYFIARRGFVRLEARHRVEEMMEILKHISESLSLPISPQTLSRIKEEIEKDVMMEEI